MEIITTEECESTDNVRKENYVCTIFTVLTNLHIYSQHNGFHNYRISEYTGNCFQKKISF